LHKKHFFASTLLCAAKNHIIFLKALRFCQKKAGSLAIFTKEPGPDQNDRLEKAKANGYRNHIYDGFDYSDF
jgi:hypothetical protein